MTTKTGITGTWDRFQGGRGPGGQPLALPAGVVVPPRIMTPPFKPKYLAEYQAMAATSRAADKAGVPIAFNSVDCLPEGMITMMNAIFPMEILETPGQVTIIQEAYNQVRRIYLDEKQGTPGDVEPVWYGHSVGHWDKGVLTVDTIGVKELARFRQGAEPMVPHSLDERITEKFKLLTPDFLQDDVTITDPVYLDAPWKFTYLYRRNPGYKIQEYVCEANHAYVDDTGHTRVDFGGAGKRAIK